MGVQQDELERLYRDRYSTFLGLALAVVPRRESAHDVVQEAFARALRRRWTFRGEGSPEAWLTRIVLRAALDARRLPHDRRLGDGEQPEAALPYPERDPRLAEALRRLPPRRRLIVFLHYFADLSYADIAGACGISVGTVSASLVQARAELLDALTEEEGADERRA